MAEWVLDFIDTSFYGSPAATGTDVANLNVNTFRVLRGGSYATNVAILRATERDFTEPIGGATDVGFRCAR